MAAALNITSAAAIYLGRGNSAFDQLAWRSTSWLSAPSIAVFGLLATLTG